MPNPKNIEPHKMKKGTTLNPNGRPRKYVSLLKEQGYKRSEINDTIQAMMAMDMVELKEVYDNPRATILEKTIANAMRKSLEKGTLYSLETLLSRVFGQPKQEVEQTIIEKPIFNSINLDVQGDDSAT
jgi:hypothetical protein